VSAGLGVAVLPLVALTLPGPPLRGVRLTAPTLGRVVSLARNTSRYESPAARLFTDFLRQGLRPLDSGSTELDGKTWDQRLPP